MEPLTHDALTVAGLSPILDEEEPPVYLELTICLAGKTYRAAILAAGEEWALSVRDARGRTLIAEPELYPTQASAVLAAMLAVLALGPG